MKSTNNAGSSSPLRKRINGKSLGPESSDDVEEDQANANLHLDEGPLGDEPVGEFPPIKLSIPQRIMPDTLLPQGLMFRQNSTQSGESGNSSEYNGHFDVDLEKRMSHPFWSAITTNNWPRLAEELRENAEAKLQMRDDVGATPFLLSVLLGETHRDISRKLLQAYPECITDTYRSDEKESYYHGENCLHITVAQKDMVFTRELLSTWCRSHEDVGTLLGKHRATGTFFSPRQQIWSYGERIACMGRSESHLYFGESVLGFAVCTNQRSMVRMLVEEYGADVMVRDGYGNGLLHLCVVHSLMGMYDVVSELMDISYNERDGLMAGRYGRCWELKNQDGLSPLMLAAKLGEPDVVGYLLDKSRILHWRFASVTAWAYPLDCLLERNGAVDIIVEMEHTQLVINPVILTFLKRKWQSGLGCLFIQRLYLSMLGVGGLTLSSILTRSFPEICQSLLPPVWMTSGRHGLTVSQSWQVWLVNLVSHIVVSVLAYGKLNVELREMVSKGGWMNYMKGSIAQKLENGCSFVGCSMALFGQVVTFVPFLWGVCDVRIAESIAVFCAWSYMLFFLLGYERTGPFVIMIVRMLIDDVLVFALVFLVFLFGFSTAFYHLFGSSSIQQFTKQLEFGFEAMLGGFDLSNYLDTENPIITTVLSIVYAILISVTLFNTLIAKMGSTYEYIMNSSTLLWAIERARIMSSLQDDYDGDLEQMPVTKFWVEIKGTKYFEIHLQDESWYESNAEDDADDVGSHSASMYPHVIPSLGSHQQSVVGNMTPQQLLRNVTVS